MSIPHTMVFPQGLVTNCHANCTNYCKKVLCDKKFVCFTRL